MQHFTRETCTGKESFEQARISTYHFYIRHIRTAINFHVLALERSRQSTRSSPEVCLQKASRNLTRISRHFWKRGLGKPGHLRWPNTVFARAFADAIQHVHEDFKKQTWRQESDHFTYSTPALTVLFFLYNSMQCIDGFSRLLQRYVRKCHDAKNPAIFSFCLLPKEPS